MKSYDIFISYASVDFNRVIQIIDTLEEMGYNCWYAPRDISPGCPYARAIIKGIETCPIFMVVLTENSVYSDNVLNEVENAHTLRKTIIPVFLNSLTLPPEMNFYIRRLHWATLDETKSANLLSALGLPPVEEIRKNKPEEKETESKGIYDNTNVNIKKKGVDENSKNNEPYLTDHEERPEQTDENRCSSEKPQSNSKNKDISSSKPDKKLQFLEKHKIQIAVGAAFIVCLFIIALCTRTSSLSTAGEDDASGIDIDTISDSIATESVPLDENAYLMESNQLVDLGLSVLWATENVGAESPTDLGDFYGWNEFMEECTINGDAICKSNAIPFKSYNGAEIRVPTASECSELLNNCTWTWIQETKDGKPIVGYKVTGKNGKSIFLPAAGRMTADGPEETSQFRTRSCNYWTSSSRDELWGAMMYLKDNDRTLAKRPKKDKLSVRVISKKNN